MAAACLPSRCSGLPSLPPPPPYPHPYPHPARAPLPADRADVQRCGCAASAHARGVEDAGEHVPARYAAVRRHTADAEAGRDGRMPCVACEQHFMQQQEQQGQSYATPPEAAFPPPQRGGRTRRRRRRRRRRGNGHQQRGRDRRRGAARRQAATAKKTSPGRGSKKRAVSGRNENDGDYDGEVDVDDAPVHGGYVGAIDGDDAQHASPRPAAASVEGPTRDASAHWRFAPKPPRRAGPGRFCAHDQPASSLRTHAPSLRMGSAEKLMLGWALLNEHCGLAQHRSCGTRRGRSVLRAMRQVVHDDRRGAPVPAVAAAAPVAVEAAVPSPAAAAVEPRPSDNLRMAKLDDVTNTAATRIKQGAFDRMRRAGYRAAG